ncbi:MAG TPA: carboxypeptidase regulatory-like domain-containing protein, partial [Vicinamibacterales bacterium]|nr:carboxypeptidase regulatory-like domain-containing protein [Vicinamibacterales bacterium]
MRALLMTVLMTALAVPALAQTGTITGRVIDARTEQPLRGVVITIDGQSLFTETDADGRFTMTVTPGSYDLSAALVGYALLRQPVTVAAFSPLTLDIRLAEGAGAFEERVTVVGTSTTTTEQGAGATTLHGRELQMLRGVTMDDPLRSAQALPAVSAPDDFHGEFAIRGLPFRQLALTVDNLPTRYLMHSVHGVSDGGSIAMLNGDAVGSLSVSPGAHAQRTGNHLGGQVDVGMREGDRQRTRARGGLSGTSAALTVEGPFAQGKGSWLVSGRRSYVDWLLKRIDADSDLAFAYSDVETKLVFDATPRHRFELLAIGGRSLFEESEENLGPNDERTVGGRSWLTGVSWRFAPSARWSFTQRIYSTGLKYENTNITGEVLDDHLASDLGVRSEAAFVAAPWAMVEAGGEFQHITGRHARDRALNDARTLTALA